MYEGKFASALWVHSIGVNYSHFQSENLKDTKRIHYYCSSVVGNARLLSFQIRTLKRDVAKYCSVLSFSHNGNSRTQKVHSKESDP